jgi:hypothetical protein
LFVCHLVWFGLLVSEGSDLRRVSCVVEIQSVTADDLSGVVPDWLARTANVQAVSQCRMAADHGRNDVDRIGSHVRKSGDVAECRGVGWDSVDVAQWTAGDGNAGDVAAGWDCQRANVDGVGREVDDVHFRVSVCVSARYAVPLGGEIRRPDSMSIR